VYGKKKKGQQQDDVITEQPRHGNRSGGDGGNYIQRVTNDEREDEMEENLQWANVLVIKVTDPILLN